MEIMKIHLVLLIKSFNSEFFQVENTPQPIKKSIGRNGIRKTKLKYGGPTEILPASNNSTNIG